LISCNLSEYLFSGRFSPATLATRSTMLISMRDSECAGERIFLMTSQPAGFSLNVSVFPLAYRKSQTSQRV
jgi:hypothetical protein